MTRDVLIRRKIKQPTIQPTNQSINQSIYIYIYIYISILHLKIDGLIYEQGASNISASIERTESFKIQISTSPRLVGITNLKVRIFAPIQPYMEGR